jgi:hypothetical protein
MLACHGGLHLYLHSRHLNLDSTVPLNPTHTRLSTHAQGAAAQVAHGDKTWAKLFPAYFHRQTLVDDLYVADTVQVDVNVTRTLEDELRADDWRLLVLHYLGLDHAGHLAGRDRFVCTRTPPSDRGDASALAAPSRSEDGNSKLWERT